MNGLELLKNDGTLNLGELGLEKEKCELIFEELGDMPTLFNVATTFYKHELYKGLDYLYTNYYDNLCDDYFMESVFLYLAKLGDMERIEYFYEKSKDKIHNRTTFRRFDIYGHNSNLADEFIYADRDFTPMFDEGLVTLCTKKKAKILDKLYSYGFKPSLKQLKTATRTLNRDTFYAVFEEMNREVIDDYLPKIVEELCYYSKIEPIKFLFENIGMGYISQNSLNKCLYNSINGNSKVSKLEIFKYILDLGADLSFDNYIVLDRIFGYGHTDILEYLYNNKLIDNNTCYFGNLVETAIHYDRSDIINYLIDSGHYFSKKYNLREDKKVLEKYASQFNKNKSSVMTLIEKLYIDDKNYIEELRIKFPRQRKLQEYLSTIV